MKDKESEEVEKKMTQYQLRKALLRLEDNKLIELDPQPIAKLVDKNQNKY